jgi:preprotein translocase subunit YajC
LVQSGLLAASKSTSSGSSSIYFLLIIFVAVYFFYLRPRRAKMLAQQRAAKEAAAPAEIAAGDTVVMTSGIIGRVLSVDGDRASVEIAPDTVIEIQRTALGRRLEPDAPDEDERWATLTDGASGSDAPTEIVHDDPETKDDRDEHPGGTQ